MLYHVPHVDVELSELARVLVADGRLIACTIANSTRPDELDHLLDTLRAAGYTFSSEDGRAMLPHCAATPPRSRHADTSLRAYPRSTASLGAAASSQCCVAHKPTQR